MKPDPIKAKIQELCKDVMELKFGCVLQKHPDGGIQTTVTHLLGTGNGSVSRVENTNKIAFYDDNIKDGKIMRNSFEAEWWTILGSPITLAVVLRAIETKYGDHILEFSGIKTCSLQAARLVAIWNLEHDNFDDQSQPTKDFIGSLILK